MQLLVCGSITHCISVGRIYDIADRACFLIEFAMLRGVGNALKFGRMRTVTGIDKRCHLGINVRK